MKSRGLRRGGEGTILPSPTAFSEADLPWLGGRGGAPELRWDRGGTRRVGTCDGRDEWRRTPPDDGTLEARRRARAHRAPHARLRTPRDRRDGARLLGRCYGGLSPDALRRLGLAAHPRPCGAGAPPCRCSPCAAPSAAPRTPPGTRTQLPACPRSPARAVARARHLPRLGQR